MRLVFALLFLGLLASAWAANIFLGGLAEEEDARIRREHAEKVAVLAPPAEGGSANAQYKLGVLYLTAHELVRDPGLAFEWFSRSASSGHAEAQYNLARLYELGEGVQQDYGLAARWYGRSAEHANHAEAQYALGQLNFRGLAPGHSRPKALKWFRRAAEGGQPVAQFLVGRMFESGWGVRKDAIKAYMWYSLAERGRDRVLSENSEYDPTKAREHLAMAMN
ncbi:MAG: sel1 repeat family protein, partial [Rhodospirillales bacterium]|nr:sel1 repeat family protein [Rhodospirillales bacterium]